MNMRATLWTLAAATALAGGAAAAQVAGPSQAPSVRAGIEAYLAHNYDEAIRQWRPLADRGDADAQYNLAQAYFLGNGVPQNSNLAEQWYARAARQGHPDAIANYGLLLFQNGQRREAIPWIERAAMRGDPRAQYVFGTTLYNGDVVPQDNARAYAMMVRASSQNLPAAVSQLAEMERHLSPQDRAHGIEIAQSLPTAPPPVQLAAATPPPPPSAPTPAPRAPRPAVHNPPPPTPAPPRVRPAPTAPVQTAAAPRPAAGGRWRVQLGAFSSEANARTAWRGFAGRLGGAQPFFVHAGAVYRLQAGPFADRAGAERACAAAHAACFPVAP
jgi:cell division septation protein DedD